MSTKNILKENTSFGNVFIKEADDTDSKKQKISLDVTDPDTSAILDEMGVSLLDEDSQDVHQEETPQTYNAENLPPGVIRLPKHTISASPSRTSWTSESSLSYDLSVALGLTHPSRPCKETVDGPDIINESSDEILLAIFGWLPRHSLTRCARVCRRWKGLAYDEMFWKRLDVSNKYLDPGITGKILDRGVQILRMSKTEICCPIYLDFQQSSFLSINSSLPNVMFLDLSMAMISADGVEQILCNCTNLIKLSLENCPLTERSCRFIGQNPSLDTLNLSMASGLSVNGFMHITSNCKRLDSLNIAWTELDRECLNFLVLCLPRTLQRLNISGCRDVMVDQDISYLVRSCPMLMELDISDATSISAAVLEDMVNHLHGLERIGISRCYQMAASCIPILARITSLLFIEIHGTLREPTLEALKEALPHIDINRHIFSEVARPTFGNRRTSIWGFRTRDLIL